MINIKYLEKIAEEEAKPNKINGILGATLGSGTGFIASQAYTLPLALKMQRENDGLFDNLFKYTYNGTGRGYDTAANLLNNAGYTEKRILEEGTETFFNPQNKKSIAVPGMGKGKKSEIQESLLEILGPHAMPGEKTLYDGSNKFSRWINKNIKKGINQVGSTTPNMTYINIGKNNDIGTVAHEIGHAISFNDRSILHRHGMLVRNGIFSGPMLGSLGLAVSPFIVKDKKTENTVDKGILLGSMTMAAPGLGQELEASYRGAKLMKNVPLKTRISPFVGIPSYAGIAAIPLLAYSSKKLLNSRSNKKDD